VICNSITEQPGVLLYLVKWTLLIYTEIIYENKIKGYAEQSMIWWQNVDKRKLNKCILQTSVDTEFCLTHCNWNLKYNIFH